MLYPSSITIDFYIQANSIKEAKRRLQKIVKQLEGEKDISPFSELGLIEQLEIESSTIITPE